MRNDRAVTYLDIAIRHSFSPSRTDLGLSSGAGSQSARDLRRKHGRAYPPADTTVARLPAARVLIRPRHCPRGNILVPGLNAGVDYQHGVTPKPSIRPVAFAAAVLFLLSWAFPIGAGLAKDVSAFPKWWGAVEVESTFVLAIAAFGIQAFVRGNVGQEAEDVTYRVYRTLTHREPW